jgi:hypothetical protein
MHTALRTFGVCVIFAISSVAWLVLGGVMSARTSSQSAASRDRVADLWGTPQTQTPPELTFVPAETPLTDHPRPDEGLKKTPSSTRIAVDLRLDQRLKGLTWYSLYDVGFRGAWTVENDTSGPGTLRVAFALPDPNAVYDAFHLTVDGAEVKATPEQGTFRFDVPVAAGQKVEIASSYKSRGLDEWRYARRDGAAPLRDFALEMTTSFADVDFPSMSLSPSSKERAGGGYKLAWRFEQLVSGLGVGMVMPKRIQPGELAASLAFSAPISLFFFFLVIAVLARLRSLDIHPINYFFLGAAFFSFHLLFAYSVDHLPLLAAFGLSSLTSVLMVLSYLRLVVSSRFAYREAAAAQLVYLVGFSLAHFWEGFTGLTLTVLSILTLFLLMLLTGRIRWSEVLRPKRDPEPGPFGPQGPTRAAAWPDPNAAMPPAQAT